MGHLEGSVHGHSAPPPQAVDQNMTLLVPTSSFGQLGGSVKEKVCGSTGIAPERMLTLSPSPQAVLKNLAEAVGGHYHCYSPETEVSPSANMLPPSSFPACSKAASPSLPASKAVPGGPGSG